MTTCKVTGVYGTVHTTGGDIDTGIPTHVNIDCEDLLFYLTIDCAPWSGTIIGSTLHFGLHARRFDVSPQPMRGGDSVTIIQRMQIVEMERAVA